MFHITKKEAKSPYPFNLFQKPAMKTLQKENYVKAINTV